jgi:hypothetical protein
MENGAFKDLICVYLESKLGALGMRDPRKSQIELLLYESTPHRTQPSSFGLLHSLLASAVVIAVTVTITVAVSVGAAHGSWS